MSPAAVPGRTGSDSRGALVVAAGLVALGVTMFVFLALSGRMLGPIRFSPIATLWALVAGIGGGLAATVEQEVTRAVAARVGAGRTLRPLLRRIAVLAGGLAAGGVFVIVLVSVPLTERVFGSDPLLVVLLAGAVVGMVALAAVRGVLAGTQRYTRYAASLAGEGVLRLLLLLGLWWMVAGSAPALAIAFTPLLAALLGSAVLPRSRGRIETPIGWRELTSNLALLLVASLLAQGLANSGAVVLAVIAPADPSLAGRFLAAFVLLRIPLFFTVAIQATALPRLVDALRLGDLTGFGQVVRTVVLKVGALGLVFLAGVAALGPLGLRLLYGPGFDLDRIAMTLLAASSVVFLLVAVVQAALVALGRHAMVAAVWALGVVAFALACLSPFDPLVRVTLAYVVSSVVVAAAFLIAIRLAVGRHVAPEDEDGGAHHRPAAARDL